MKTIQISDELAEELSGVLCDGGAVDISSFNDFVGKSLFIRTVTYHWVGKVKAVNGSIIELESASVVFDSGSLVKAMADGTLSTKERVGKAWVMVHAITDMFPWEHKL